MANGYFSKWMRKLDEINKAHTSFSILDELYAQKYKKSDLFQRTLYTHPALFMVQYSLAQELIHQNITPDYVLGSSLGEFVAAAIAGVINYEDAMFLVIQQAHTLERNSKRGGMVAILDKPGHYYGNPLLTDNSEIAGINYDTHYIVSGDYESIVKIEDHLRSQSVLHQFLAVKHGFHSSAIDDSKNDFLELLNSTSFKKPMLPYVSCAYASQVHKVEASFLWDVIRKEIAFKDTLNYLEKNGEYIYLDIGPSGTLKGFAAQNIKKNSNSSCIGVLSPFGQDLNSVNEIQNRIDACSIEQGEIKNTITNNRRI